MSIIRVGLAETKKFAEGYDAIFGKPKNAGAEPARTKSAKKAGKPAKKKAKRK